MQFLYVFALMFISIFGLATLVHLFAKALLDGSARAFDVYVRDDENIEEFLDRAERSPYIGKIYIIVDKDSSLEKNAYIKR